MQQGTNISPSCNGYDFSEITETLKVARSTVGLDIGCLKMQAKENVQNHLNECQPYELERAFMAIDTI